MDPQIKTLQRLPNLADQEQIQSLAELIELKKTGMPAPEHFFVSKGLTALRTQQGIDALKYINPYINDLNANMTAAKLVALDAGSFIVMNQTFNFLKISSNEDFVSNAVELNNRLKVPVLLYLGGTIHLINGDTTVAQLFNEAKEPAQLLQQAKDFRKESIEEIRNNQRLQQYLAADFAISANLLDQLLAIPDLQQIGIANCAWGQNTKDFARSLKNLAAKEGIPICFAASYGSTEYLIVVDRDTNVEKIYEKLEQYTNEARERSERLLDKALDNFLLYDESLRRPENMLKWLTEFKNGDFYIKDSEVLDSIERRAATLGYSVGKDQFISSRMFDPEKYNQISAYMLSKSDEAVDRIIIANCLQEIIEGGTLVLSIGIPRRAEFQAQLDQMNS